MRNILLHQKDIHIGNLILVNQVCPIINRSNKSKINLVSVNAEYSEILLEMRSATMLSQLIEDLKCGNDIVHVSGYRSVEEQVQIYSDSMADNGEAFTVKYVALPNRSEHQTGLAIDLAKKQENINFVRPYFPYTGICQVFRQKAIQYGFIERYPEGKEEITGIAHEPWHFRYVGYPHSEIMQKEGLTLEEYIEAIKNFRYQEKHLTINRQMQSIEIFYVHASDSLQTMVEVLEDVLYQISGNNVDGFIVIMWRKTE